MFAIPTEIQLFEIEPKTKTMEGVLRQLTMVQFGTSLLHLAIVEGFDGKERIFAIPDTLANYWRAKKRAGRKIVYRPDAAETANRTPEKETA